MKANPILGLVVSTVLHLGLAFMLLPLLWADQPKPEEPEPILLELSLFEPPPVILPESVPLPEPEPSSEPVAEAAPLPTEPVVAEPEPEPPPKKDKPVEPPPAKPAPKPIEQPVERKKPAPPTESKPVVEQPLPKPEPDLELLKKQQQEYERLVALRAQRQREFVEQQQQAQQRQRLEQQKQQEQAKRRAEWEQAQHQQREAARKQQARAARAAAVTQSVKPVKSATPVKPAAVQVAASSNNNELPLMSHPRYRRPPSPPEYPRRALEAGIEGTVLVRVTISAQGNIMAVLVHQSSGNASLDAAALKAVRSWSFMPAQRDGKPIPSIVQLPVRFKLSG